MAYVVLTPIAIVPIVLLLARHWLTPEEVSLGVIAFASLGHHLPGFMRAYGDRELFLRFRWRFLLVPPLVLGLALLFTPPSQLAGALHLPWQHLHGLDLILLIWGTWHGLMQTYGFMRIYDVRLGVNDAWSARLDHWLCVVVFVAGVVFSDARVYGVANAMWQSGLPLFGPNVLYVVRSLVAAAGIGTVILYAINLLNRKKAGHPVSWIKLWLVGITGWFYWYTGRLSTNLLIGLAMFEIYHAVQYYAIVWIYNRRLMERAGNRFGPLGFLFRNSRTMLCVYLAAIAAYSSIRLLASDANEYVYQPGSEDAHQWLMALFVTSSFLHFYFDGFIWKVSERKTQENLVDSVTEGTPLMHYVSGLSHLGKWAILLAVVGGLFYSEWQRRDQWQTLKASRVHALAELTPSLPETQSLLAQEALVGEDPQTAIEHAQKALQLRPRSHAIRGLLGAALLKAGRLEEAQQEFEQAIKIAPRNWSYHTDLGKVLVKLGETQAAEQRYLQAVEVQPHLETPRQHLVEFYLSLGRTEEAQQALDAIADRFPLSQLAEINQVLLLSQEGKHAEATKLATLLQAGSRDDWRINLALGSALNSAGDYREAMRPLLRALKANRTSPEIYYQLGLASAQSGDYSSALVFLGKATRLDPLSFRAKLQLANAYYLSNQSAKAVEAFRKAAELEPNHPELCGNLGGVLAQMGKLDQAREVYLRGLDAHPDSPTLNYNLGLLHFQLGELEDAGERIRRAQSLGITIPPEVLETLGE